MKSETMTPTERFETVLKLKEPDRVPICPLGLLFAAPYAGISMEKFYNDKKASQDAQRQVFDALGGWDVVGLGGPTMTEVLALMTIYPNKIKRPGKELPPDFISQFDESEPSMSFDEYDIIIKKGWNHFFFKYIFPRILPQDAGKFFRTGRGILRLLHFAWTFKQDIRYWEKRGIPVLISTPCNVPYEMFSAARTFNRFIMDIHQDPKKITAAMDAILPTTIATAVKGAKFLGVPRVFVACERGAGDVISPKYFENFYFPWLKRLVDALVKENITPLLHLDSNWDRNLPYLKELPQGKCILDLDSTTNIFRAKEILGDHMCIMGDIPASLFTLGTPEEVETYCKKLIDEVGKGGGFILSSGCSVPYNVKFENLKAMIHTGKTYQLSKK